MKRRGLVLLGLVVGAATAIRATRQEPRHEAAPALSIACAEGSRLDLGSLRGRRVLLEFFAVWCPECRRDVARLEDISRRYAGSVEVLGVALEGDPAGVEAAVREAGGSYRVGVADPSARSAYGVRRVPTRYLVDERGVLVARDADFRTILGALDP